MWASRCAAARSTRACHSAESGRVFFALAETSCTGLLLRIGTGRRRLGRGFAEGKAGARAAPPAEIAQHRNKHGGTALLARPIGPFRLDDDVQNAGDAAFNSTYFRDPR